jgi:hypothetical protein
MKASKSPVVTFEALENREMLHALHTSVHHEVVAATRHVYHASAHRTTTPAPVAPSAALSLSQSGGVLTITGTTGNDQITVLQSGNTFTVKNGSWSTTVTGTFSQIVVKGNGGNDTIVINDSVTESVTIYGGSGTDSMTGNNANDTFYGGTGYNTMTGGTGYNTFVTLGTKGDTITGGGGDDSFWLDNSRTEIVTDLTRAEINAGHYHQVSSYINGSSLADPKTTESSIIYKNYANDPLFGSGGPSENDIYQGYIGDCYYMSALSAVAKVDPDLIRQSIVSLGDGTFAAEMHTANGQTVFVHMNADLPTWNTGGIAYAGLGTGNSLWAALLEKAFTYVRSGANPLAASYSTIDNGGWMSESFTALGLANSNYFPSSASQLDSELEQLLNAGDAVTIAIENPEDGAPLIGDHAYTVDHVTTNSKGVVTSITLRNPWGVDGAGNDGDNDGYVTMTPAQLYASMMGGTAATV